MPSSASAGSNSKNRKAGVLAPAFEFFSPNLAVLARSRSFMGLLDRVILTACHDIIGIIAVHNKQFNFVWRGALLVAPVLFLGAGQPGSAGTITGPSRPDPLLDSGPTSPCAASVDYAAGTDANGQPVIPADVAAAPVPLPDGIAIPLGNNRGNQRARRSRSNAMNGDSAYVSLDGQKLEPLLNPPPCIDPGR